MQLSTISYHLQQISDMLVLNGTLTECPGLVHGKMGIAIFFFHYARFTNNMLFADYAMDILGAIQEQIHINSPADYESGIAGIGVGFDYLIRNEFLLTKEDICEDFDERMYRAVMYEPWSDFSMYDGLIGYGRYWMTRLCYQEASKMARESLQSIIMQIESSYADIPEENHWEVYCFLYDLQKVLGFTYSSRLSWMYKKWSASFVDIEKSFLHLSHSMVGDVVRVWQYNRYNNVALDNLELTFEQIRDLDVGKFANMGLLNGLAGEGLLRLAVLDLANIVWMQLL